MLMKNKYGKQIKIFIKQNYKFLLLFASFSIVFLFALSFFSYSIVNTTYSALSNYIIKERNKEDSLYSYAEVKFENGKDYGQFFYSVDDATGVALKRNNDTFFTPLNELDENRVEVQFDGNNYETSFVLSTQWDFTSNHYGFELICGEIENISRTNGVYITKEFALQLILPLGEDKCDIVLNKEIKYGSKVFEIKGVIDSATIQKFERLLGSSFIVSSYMNNTSTFNKLKYSFLMHGDFTSTYAIIFSVESTIKNTSKIESYYFNWNGSKFYLGDIQNLKTSSFNSNRLLAISLSTIILLLLCIGLLVFIIYSKRKNGLFFPASLSSKCSPTIYLAFLIVTFLLLIYYLITRALGTIIIANSFKCFYDPKAFSVVLIIWCAISVALLLLFKSDYKKRRLVRDNIYYEVNI
jgi:succinate dehydrogenase hydrophobic anchor subunit